MISDVVCGVSVVLLLFLLFVECVMSGLLVRLFIVLIVFYVVL